MLQEGSVVAGGGFSCCRRRVQLLQEEGSVVAGGGFSCCRRRVQLLQEEGSVVAGGFSCCRRDMPLDISIAVPFALYRYRLTIVGSYDNGVAFTLAAAM